MIICLGLQVSRKHCVFFHAVDKLFVTDLKVYMCISMLANCRSCIKSWFFTFLMSRVQMEFLSMVKHKHRIKWYSFIKMILLELAVQISIQMIPHYLHIKFTLQGYNVFLKL